MESPPPISRGQRWPGRLGQVAIEYLEAGGRPLSATRVWQHMRSLVPYEEYAVQHEAEWQLGILVPGPDSTLDFVLRQPLLRSSRRQGTNANLAAVGGRAGTLYWISSGP